MPHIQSPVRLQIPKERFLAPAAPGKLLRATLAVLCLLLGLTAPNPCLAADSLASDPPSAKSPASGITHEALVGRAAKNPLAALELAQFGIDQCDSDYFNQAVDLPSVVDKASTALIEVLRVQASQAGLGEGGQPLLLVMLAAADDNTLAMLKPLLTSEVRGFVNTGINGGYFAGQANGSARPAKGSLASALEKMPPGRRQIVPGKILSQEGDAASVAAQFIDPKAGSFALLLTMQRENGLWRVKEISNAKSLFTEAARRER